MGLTDMRYVKNSGDLNLKRVRENKILSAFIL